MLTAWSNALRKVCEEQMHPPMVGDKVCPSGLHGRGDTDLCEECGREMVKCELGEIEARSIELVYGAWQSSLTCPCGKRQFQRWEFGDVAYCGGCGARIEWVCREERREVR